VDTVFSINNKRKSLNFKLIFIFTLKQKFISYTKFKDVTKKEAQYFQKLIKEILKENDEIVDSLHEYYDQIKIYIFKTGKEKQQLDITSDFFGRKFTELEPPSPAHATSENKKRVDNSKYG